MSAQVEYQSTCNLLEIQWRMFHEIHTAHVAGQEVGWLFKIKEAQYEAVITVPHFHAAEGLYQDAHGGSIVIRAGNAHEVVIVRSEQNASAALPTPDATEIRADSILAFDDRLTPTVLEQRLETQLWQDHLQVPPGLLVAFRSGSPAIQSWIAQKTTTLFNVDEPAAAPP